MKKRLTLVLTPILLLFLYLSLSSSSGGITGQSVNGCTCHGPTPSAATVVSLTGLPAGGYTNGTVYPVTVTVTNSTFTGSAGFDLTASGGSFTAIAGTFVTGGTEIGHNTPKPRVAGSASWTFNWTAPASGNNNITFNLAGNAVNLNGNTSGDQWNSTSLTIFKSGVVLGVSATASNIACNGGTSTITASGFGPTPPYQYSRNGGAFQTSATFTSNLAGTYTITVKDATTLTASTVLTITQPTAIVANASNTTIACNGGVSTITASGTGGTGAYNYRLNTGAFVTTPSFTNNLAGTYTVTVRDANLCTKTTTIVVTQPTVLTFTAPTIVAPLCNGGTGSASISATGGTGTKTYSISPLGPQSNTSGNFTGLTAQNYTITVTDANNCTKTTATSITQPTALNLNVLSTSPVFCNGGNNGSVNCSATGGTGTRTFTINPLGPQANTGGNFIGLTAQAYTITLTDANGCATNSAISITQPSLITFSTPVVNNPVCASGTGSMTVTATGGTGTLNYTIAPSGPQLNTNGVFTGLLAQTYTVTAMDNNNCTRSTVVAVTQPTPLTFTSPTVVHPSCIGNTNGSINLTATGGIGIKTYSITPSGPQTNTNGEFTGLGAQTYTITVQDASNCTMTTAITLTQATQPCGTTLNLTCYLQGYYAGSGLMIPAAYNESFSTNPLLTDSITVELHDTIAPYALIESKQLALMTNGTASGLFNTTGSAYIVIRHRNTLGTWSAGPVSLSGTTTYNFSTSASQAYGSNQVELETGTWGMYSGDLNFDENADLLDLGLLESDINNFLFGYFNSDINGDGNVDLLDIPILEANINAFIFSAHP